MLLMMAKEMVITQQPRSAAVQAHVDTLIKLTRRSDLPEHERQSLVTSLDSLKRESIGQAGRRLAAAVGDREYMVGTSGGSENPTQFFNRCYGMRSALVHGQYSRPSRDDVGSRAASLEYFVGDLLSGGLLHYDPETGETRQNEPPPTPVAVSNRVIGPLRRAWNRLVAAVWRRRG